MRGVEIHSGADGENVKLIGQIDRFGAEDLIHPSLEDAVHQRDAELVWTPPMKSIDDISGWVKREGLNGLFIRTGFDLKDPRFYEQNPEIALIVAACRDPHVNGFAAATHGVDVLRADANTENVANHVLGTMKYGLGMMQLPSAISMRDGVHSDGHRGRFLKKALQDEMFELPDKVLGIIGYGQVGQKLAVKAVQDGMDVVIYNDTTSDAERAHDSRMREAYEKLMALAQTAGVNVTFATSVDQVVETVDILSLHTSSTNAEGEENERDRPVVTLEQLAKMNPRNQIKGRNRLGIVMNYARDEHVGGTFAERFGLIKEGNLKYYVSDVVPREVESEKAWSFPVDLNDPNAFRLITHPHLGGSGRWVAEDTVKDMSKRLLVAYDEGHTPPDQSRVFPRHSLDRVKRRSGQLVVVSHLATENITPMGSAPDAIRTFEDIFKELHLRVTDRQWVAKYLDGTKKDHGGVPVSWALDMNGEGKQPYGTRVKDLVDAALRGVHGLRSFRVIPTSPDQKDWLFDRDTRLTSLLAAM